MVRPVSRLERDSAVGGFKIRISWAYTRYVFCGENIAEGSIHEERIDHRIEAAMITTELGVILARLFYGGLLAICIFLLGQLLPLVYVFVSGSTLEKPLLF
jgi:hypothetical protein